MTCTCSVAGICDACNARRSSPGEAAMSELRERAHRLIALYEGEEIADVLAEAMRRLSNVEQAPAMSELVERLRAKAACIRLAIKDDRVAYAHSDDANVLDEAAAALSRAEASFASRTDELKRLAKDWTDERDRASRAEAQRDELLCRIHRDGGQYLHKHGVDKACDDADEIVADAFGQRDALQAFKNFVHRRLDEAGVPTHPDGPHSKQGCRIGDRLDIVLSNFPKAE